MRELFGADGYYLELQDHSLPEDPQIVQGLLRLHEDTGIPLVATNDAHYLSRHPDGQNRGRSRPNEI